MPKLITTSEITEIAKTFESAAVDTCILYRYTDVEADYGGYTGTAIPYGTVSCHVSRGALVTPEYRTTAEQAAPDTLWTVLVPRGTDINDHDLITWSNSYGGGTVQVVESLPRTWEVVRRAFCRNTHDITLPS